MAIDWFSTAFDPTSLPPNLQAAYRHWLSCTDGSGLPEAAHFNPLELPVELLPNIAIFDMGQPGDAGTGRYLMVGTELVRFYGLRVGAGRLSELIADNRQALLEDIGDQLAEDRRPVHVRFADKGDQGVDFAVDLLLLPLGLSQDGPNLVVGVNHVVESPG
jgi:hypothetical protein